MARTAIKADRSDVLHASKGLTFSTGAYSYKIASDGDQPPLYTVSSEKESSSARLTWAFGSDAIQRRRRRKAHSIRLVRYRE
jgi:hypothetical protein